MEFAWLVVLLKLSTSLWIHSRWNEEDMFAVDRSEAIAQWCIGIAGKKIGQGCRLAYNRKPT